MINIIISILLLLCSCIQSKNAVALNIMLPQVYEGNIYIPGWLVSEKLYGVRGYWNGNRLLTKNGLPFHPPDEFLQNFPEVALERKIWGARKTWLPAGKIAKRNTF